MKQDQPILSCAGREAVSIDSVLLTELLLSFRTTTIGIQAKAAQVADAMQIIANGEYPNNALDVFKDIITTEFLSVQLMEAAKLAKQKSAESVAATDANCF